VISTSAATSFATWSRRQATSTTRLKVEITHDVHLSEHDVKSVDALLVSRPEFGVSLSRAWLSSLLSEPPPHSEASLLLLREATVIRGILPITIRRTMTHACVGLLGAGISDRVDLLAERGYEAPCAERFFEWLGESFGPRGFVLQLRDVPAHSALWGCCFRSARLDLRAPTPSIPAPFR
jgi:hypothetical protein